jgi:triphosphoribosyl-dephospho-CoA synthase
VSIEAAFREACAAELAALKPGNVHRHAAGHGMTVDDFLRSAEAAAVPLCRVGASLGERVLDAIAATRAAVGQNTNLGIVLLCAPLAQAAERGGPDLREGVRAVIAESDLDDADKVFHAIALASPGGLGTAARHDVRAPATVLLPDAMAEADARDSVARQWTTGFADVFETGLPAFDAALARWNSETWAVTDTYLRVLARFPDSHIARKHGVIAAETVRQEAEAALARLDASARPEALAPDLLTWDAALKRRGLNPGTSADLTVATIFAWRLGAGLRPGRFAG